MAKSFPNTGTTVIDAVGDLPGSPSEGMMVFQKDTNELKIYDGSVWRSMLDTDTPPSEVLLASATVSNAANLTFENCFSSDYINYNIIINLSTAVDDYVAFVFRNSNADLATAAYDSIRFGYDTASNGGVSISENNNKAYFTYHSSIGSTGNDKVIVQLNLFNNQSVTTKRWNGTTVGVRNGGRTQGGFIVGSYAASSASATGIKFTANGGGNIYGSVYVYGKRLAV
tara:strand:+ start:439 stop:1119 length:681 start_codon:yes stop_codon:yes gene_type:complete